MKSDYAVNEIPATGLIIEEELSQQEIDFILGDALSAAAASSKLKLELQRHNSNVRLDGTITVEFAFGCSRCAGDASKRLPIPLRCVFSPQPEEDEEGDIDIWGMDSERECIPYLGKTIDLIQTLTELIVFALPAYPTCSDDCRGLCPQCGCNLNVESCTCTGVEIDPRWAKLEKIKLGG